AGARGGRGRARLRRGGRRLLRHPPARKPARRLGLAPERDPLWPRGADATPARVRAEVRGPARPAPAPLVRLPPRPRPHRVLAGPPRPPPRTPPLRAPRRHLVRTDAVSLSGLLGPCPAKRLEPADGQGPRRVAAHWAGEDGEPVCQRLAASTFTQPWLAYPWRSSSRAVLALCVEPGRAAPFPLGLVLPPGRRWKTGWAQHPSFGVPV